jgi:putative transcriptional regulator
VGVRPRALAPVELGLRLPGQRASAVRVLDRPPIERMRNAARDRNNAAVDSFKGQLLVATPSLYDPNFRRSVVLIAEHSDQGAMGVVLNRPSDSTVADAVPDLATLVEERERLHVGGPVEPQAVIVLAEFADGTDAATLVTGDIGFVSADSDFALVAAATRRARVYAGYSGWGPGQLESELEEDSWLVEPVDGANLFPEPDEDLYATVLRRKGGMYRVLALMPSDPRVN